MFVNNYDSNTNTASTTIYKFGYNYYNYDDEGNYVGTETEISTAIPSTVTSFSAYVDPYAGFDPEPVIDYNVELNMFYFPDPEYVIHPSYTYRFFEMNGDTYYIYKAPKWVAKEDTGKQFLIDNMVVITGSNDSNYKVLSSLLYDSYY
ncbi:MAG: hypothetical protein J6S85_26130 [Methanobrevibacter sp.]|nr:hypothetical protein [Methanobrevibacter sp.]MBO7717071.1 hypothetical protein [Methanobrevibacter sp.]